MTALTPDELAAMGALSRVTVFKVGDMVRVRSERLRLTDLGSDGARGTIKDIRRVQNEEMRRSGQSPKILYDVKITNSDQVLERVPFHRITLDNDLLGAIAEATDAE